MASLPDTKQFARKSIRTLRERWRLRMQLVHATLAFWVRPAFPDFMVIGAARAATTWVHSRLRKHPAVFLPNMKELHFFDEEPQARAEIAGMDLRRRLYFQMDKPSHLRWYALQLADGQGRLRGDITPGYSALSQERVQLIADLMPELKVIFILRDPVERAWSGLRRTLWWRKAMYPEDIQDSTELLELALHPEILKLGDYEATIRKWENCFDSKQILYLFYEDICQKPKQQLETICRFLGIDSGQLPYEEKDSERVNVAPKSDMPTKVRSALTERYADQIPFIEAKFARDLSHWSRAGHTPRTA